MRLIPSALQTAARPRLACALTAEAIFAAHSASPGAPLQSAACQGLSAGVITPAWKSPIIPGHASAEALQNLKVLQQVAGKSRSKQVTLVVPDICVRVLVLDFESLPAKASEALPLVRFRLRKMLPFDADTAAVSYQVFSARTGTEEDNVRVLVCAAQAELREELESLVRNAGFEPGAILPATLAALAAVPEEGAHLLVHTGLQSVTTAITRGNNLLLYRTVERNAAATAAPADPYASRDVTPPAQEDDLVQAILMAAAYYEDTLGRTPDHVLVAGSETPESLFAQLNSVCDWQIPLRSLVRTEHFLAEAVPNGMPACLFAGVVGALHG
jgi:type IV pilus assembly protein PilM